jgi:hypothetical protein
MTETENHPGRPRPPSQTTTMGATARIGTVWDATMYGRKPRNRISEWTRTMARRKPTEAPRRKPTAASFAVKSAASKRTEIKRGPFRRDGSNSWPNMSWMCGNVRSLTSNGQVSPTASPNAL